jgi:hypothetical protein
MHGSWRTAIFLNDHSQAIGQAGFEGGLGGTRNSRRWRYGNQHCQQAEKIGKY